MDNAPALATDDSQKPASIPEVNEVSVEVSSPQTQAEEFTPPPINPPPTPLSEYAPSDEVPVAEPEKDELARLFEDPSGPFALQSGTAFTIRQLRLRELLRLLRIVTRGAVQSMPAINLNFENPDEFVQGFIALVIFSIPEAEDETVDFVQSMVDVVPSGNADLDMKMRVKLYEELENPELEDLITIITIIVASEGSDLAALGKRLRSMLAAARKMGQVPDSVSQHLGG